jgi:hypothetical protein
MEEVVCSHGCDKRWREEDTVPCIQMVDGTYAQACRKCVSDWIKEGFLWPIPFWVRKENPYAGR